MTDYSELIVFGICLLLSGFYSGSEAALVSISIDRAKQLIEEGGSRANAFEFLINRPTTVLTTILVGNNLVNILAASITTVWAGRYFEHDAVAIATGATTFLILIFGEIIPKTVARKHSEKLAVVIIRVLQFNYYSLYFLIKPITFIIKVVLGKNADLKGRIVTKSDIEFMVSKAEKEKSMDSKQIDLITSVLEFPTIKVKDVMIPRKNIQAIKKSMSFIDIVKEIRHTAHSRYPVIDNEMDAVMGFLHVKDLAYVTQEESENFNIEKYLKPPFYIYEHMKIQAVFDHMKKKKIHLGLVKDENGLIVGIITMEDIIEEIVGEIQDEHDDEEDLTVVEKEGNLEDGLVIDGSISLRDLYNDFDIKIPLNDNYSTLTGFILDMLGNNFPLAGQIIFWEGYSFKIDSITDHEIDKIIITHVDGDHIYKQAEEEEEVPQ